MPQWLMNLWAGDGRGPVLAVVGLIAAVLIVFALYKFLVGNRLRLPGGGRARQPRLGVVDAFSLDGQRQLVLVRRDNVEHLVMIGGPTDVVVESQIVRVSAPIPAPPRERDVAAPATAAAPFLPTAPAAKAAAPISRTEPAVIAVREPKPGPQRPAPSPASESKFESKSSPPADSPHPPVEAPPPAAKPSAPAPVAAIPPVAPPAPRPVVPRPPLPPPIVNAAPRPRTTPLPPTLAASAPPSSPESPKREELRADMASPETAKPETSKPESAKPEDAFADLESLEAEMARLLGREP